MAQKALRGSALRALAELPGGAAVGSVLQRWANDHRAADDASNAAIPETSGPDGRTEDADVEEAIHVALDAGIGEGSQLRRMLLWLAVSRTLSTRSRIGCEWDPLLHRKDAIRTAEAITTESDPVATTEAAVSELQRTGLILTRTVQGPPGDPSWDALGPHRFFFCRTDALFHPWDPCEDAKELCRRAVHTRVLSSSDLDAQLRWGPRRLNSAITYAQLQSWISVPYRPVPADPYVLRWAYLADDRNRAAGTWA